MNAEVVERTEELAKLLDELLASPSNPGKGGDFLRGAMKMLCDADEAISGILPYLEEDPDDDGDYNERARACHALNRRFNP